MLLIAGIIQKILLSGRTPGFYMHPRMYIADVFQPQVGQVQGIP